MKTLEMNLNRSSYPNSLMLLTWYLIFTLYIPPSLVLSIVLNMLLHLSFASIHSQQGFPFINFLVYSICLFSLTLSFHVLFRVFFSKTFKLLFTLILDFFTHTFNSQKIKKNSIKEIKTSILTKGRWWSFLLGIPLVISILFFWALSLLHYSSKPLQLGCVPLLALY